MATRGLALIPWPNSCAAYAITSSRNRSLSANSNGLKPHHHEILLARAAIRAGPVDWHVFPAGARRDPVVGGAGFLAVDKAADQAHPALVFRGFRHGERGNRLKLEIDFRAVTPMPSIFTPRFTPPLVLRFAA